MEFTHEIKNQLSTINGLLDLMAIAVKQSTNTRATHRSITSYTLLIRQLLQNIVTTVDDQANTMASFTGDVRVLLAYAVQSMIPTAIGYCLASIRGSGNI